MEEPRTTALPHPGGTVPVSRGGFKDAFPSHAAHAKPPPHGRGSRQDAGPQLGLAARSQPPRHKPASRDPTATPHPPTHFPFIFSKIRWSRSVLPLPVPHRQGPEQLVKIKFYKFHSLSMHLRALLTFSSIPWPVIKPHICMLIFSPLTHLRKMFTVEKTH